MRAILPALLLLLVPASPTLAAPKDDGIRIGAVRAHLYYQRSGVLSEDLVAWRPHFNGWNTVIGEGDAEEPAENLLVVATVVNPGGEAWLNEKLTLRVTGEKGRQIKERVFSGLLLADKGTLHLPMWLDDAGCIGPVTISATFRGKSVAGTLQLMCGE